MRKPYLLSLLALQLLIPSIATASTLYRCSDEFGHTTYTNYKAGNRKCTVLSHEETSRGTPSSGSGSGKGAAAKPSPADFPKVANETQKSRDGDRRYILEQEVEAETRNLEEVRRTLSRQLSGPASAPEQVQPLRDRIALHERNLDALRREISNLK